MIRTILFVGFLFVTTACIHKIDDLNIVPVSPEISFPVGTFTLKAENITKIDSVLIEEGPQGGLQIYYESEVLREPLFDRLSIPNQSFGETVPFISFPFTGGIFSDTTFSQYNSFSIDNIDLTSPPPSLEQVIFKLGTLSVSQSKDFDHDLETTIEFLTLTKDGSPLTIVLNNNSSFDADLANAELDLTGESGTATNTIEYKITSVVSNTGSDTQGTLSVNVSLNTMEFSFMKGDFNTYQFDEVSDTFETGLPDSEFPDNIAFTNPSVEIGVLNSSGIPFGLDINELSVIKNDGSVEAVTGTYDDETFEVNAAATPGETEESAFLIDKNNTDNFVELLNEIPESVFFNGQITANHLGTPPGGNFVTDSSEVVVNSRFVLPLEGYANQYMFTDTLDANLAIDSDIVTPENVNLRLQGENGFPMLIALQLYFLDSADNSIILDSLFLTNEEQQLFPAGEVDNAGLVVAPTIQTNDVSIDNEKYERIKGTGSIKLAAYITTPGASENPPESVKISINDYFTIGVGVSVKATIDPNETN